MNSILKVSSFSLGTLLVLTGCSFVSEDRDEEFSTIIQTETSNFLTGEELLTCTLEEFDAEFFDQWSGKPKECLRNKEMMVYSAQRIVRKFSEMSPTSELKPLVEESLEVLKPLANSNYEKVCEFELIKNGKTDECRKAEADIAGGPKALQGVWNVLDKWQPYF